MLTARLIVRGTSAKKRVSSKSSNPTSFLILVVVATIVLNAALSARAQTTLTWATPGANSDIANGPNWVGGVAPNFAGDATTDSAIFSASTNTAVKLRNVTTGDSFATVTFDATAPAYTFTAPTADYNGNGIIDAADYVQWRNNPAGFGGDPAGYNAWRSGFGGPAAGTNELVILPAGNMTNSSANTQTLTGIAAVTLNGATGAAGTLFATSGNAGTKLSFDVNQIKYNTSITTLNTANVANAAVVDLSAGFDVRTSTLFGVVNGAVTSALYVRGNVTTGTGGTLFITGESNNTGRLVIDVGGVVRINHNNALGDPTLTTPTAANSNSQTLLLGGGGKNGRLELEGNITVAEGITIGAHQNNDPNIDGIRSPSIVNVSGTNTLTGAFTFTTGGNAYGFGSNAGTLVIQSNLTQNASFDRYFTFQGAGNIVVNGNITSTTATGDAPLVKYDSGTTTINGASNTKIGQLSIRGGTLALGASAEIAFAVSADDIDEFDPRNQAPQGPEGTSPRVTLDAGTTFDVSAKAGGFNLTQTLQGKGTVKGTVNMASGTRVRPGAANFYDGQGMSVAGTDDGIGTLSFDGAGSGLNLSAGSILNWQLGALSTSNPGVDFDQVAINNGNIALGGTSNVALDFTLSGDPNSGDPFWNSPQSWKIIDTTTNTGSTNFASITNGTFTLGHFTTTVGTGANAGDILLNYVLGAGSGMGSGSVPEPASVMLVVLGSFGSLLIRKR